MTTLQEAVIVLRAMRDEEATALESQQGQSNYRAAKVAFASWSAIGSGGNHD